MSKIKLEWDEVKLLITTIIASSFILSFNDWGTTTFNFIEGFRNLVLTALIVSVSLILKIYVQKYAARRKGMDAVFKPWIIGLIIGLFFIIVSNGKFVFLAFGGLVFYAIETLRAGHPKEHMNFTLMGWISVLGPITNIIIAALANLILAQSYVLDKIVSVNLWFAVFGLIPIPFIHKFKSGGKKEFGTSDGLKLLYASIVQYLIVLIILFINITMILLLSPISAFYFTIICMACLWVVFYLFYTQNLKKSTNKVYRYKFE